jgi:hypothetical protein
VYPGFDEVVGGALDNPPFKLVNQAGIIHVDYSERR